MEVPIAVFDGKGVVSMVPRLLMDNKESALIDVCLCDFAPGEQVALFVHEWGNMTEPRCARQRIGRSVRVWEPCVSFSNALVLRANAAGCIEQTIVTDSWTKNLYGCSLALRNNRNETVACAVIGRAERRTVLQRLQKRRALVEAARLYHLTKQQKQ